MPHQVLFVKFHCIDYNCYQWFPFGFASLFHIWEHLSLINITLGAVHILLVSTAPQRNHHHHILHQKYLSVTLVYMLYPFQFPMRQAHILLQPQAHHTQSWSSDQFFYKPRSMMWIPMMYSHFRCRDISLDKRDDMLETFLSVNFFKASTSTQSVALPKAIMKLIIVGISNSFLKSQSSIMFCGGSILQLVWFCCLHFIFHSYLLCLKVIIEGKKQWIVLLAENENTSENLCSSWFSFVW